MRNDRTNKTEQPSANREPRPESSHFRRKNHRNGAAKEPARTSKNEQPTKRSEPVQASKQGDTRVTNHGSRYGAKNKGRKTAK